MVKDISENICPYCKEEIKEDAVKCKHCCSNLSPKKPTHEGICPYCKEEIKEDAVKCKHCKSNLSPNMNSGCEDCGDKWPTNQKSYPMSEPNMEIQTPITMEGNEDDIGIGFARIAPLGSAEGFGELSLKKRCFKLCWCVKWYWQGGVGVPAFRRCIEWKCIDICFPSPI